MEKRNGLIFVMMLALAALGMPSCNPSRLTVREINTSSLEKKILIAAWKTDFKDAVVEKLVQGLRSGPYYIRVVDVRDLDAESMQTYTAAVLLDSCWAWSLSAATKRFLAAAQDKSRIVLAVTAVIRGWKPKDTGVDIISTASDAEKAEEVARTVLAKLRKTLAGGY